MYITPVGVYLFVPKLLEEALYGGFEYTVAFVVFMIVTFLASFFLSSKVMAIKNVKNKIFEITNIEGTQKLNISGAFGRWLSVNVYIKDIESGTVKVINMYPELTEGLIIGQRVGVVKRPAMHNYEMDKYYMIPENKFDVKMERKKYIKGIEIDGALNTGWLSHVKVKGMNNND